MNNLWIGSLLTRISETGLGSWSLRTSTLTPEPSEPSTWLLTLKSYVTGEPFTTHYTTRAHSATSPLGALHPLGPDRELCLRTSAVRCGRGTGLCRGPYHGSWTECAWTKGMPAHLPPSPSYPPLPAGLQKCLCGPGESWVFHRQTGRGGQKSLVLAQWAGKAHPVFRFLYNNLFFFFYKPEIKNVWERETHQLFLQPRTCPHSPRPETDIKQRPCVIAVKSCVPFHNTHEEVAEEVTDIAIPTSCSPTSRSGWQPRQRGKTDVKKKKKKSFLCQETK